MGLFGLSVKDVERTLDAAVPEMGWFVQTQYQYLTIFIATSSAIQLNRSTMQPDDAKKAARAAWSAAASRHRMGKPTNSATRVLSVAVEAADHQWYGVDHNGADYGPERSFRCF